MRKKIRVSLQVFVLSVMLLSCINDDVTADMAVQPEFSCEVLDMGTVFTGLPSPVYAFKVYNRDKDGIVIGSIAFRDESVTGRFLLNVDGASGEVFENILIRGKDSIYVFVEAVLPPVGTPEPVRVSVPLDFMTNGVRSTVLLEASAQDVVHVESVTLDGVTEWDARYPYNIYGNVTVPEGSTLNIARGARLYFHAGAGLHVYGHLVVDGTSDAPVVMCGDRFGCVASSAVPYDVVPGQWRGIELSGASSDGNMNYTTVANTERGIVADGTSRLHLLNCRLRNSSSSVLSAVGADVTAVGCEFSGAPSGVVVLDGGHHLFNHCTIANDYIFAPVEEAMLILKAEHTEVSCANSIVYGLGALMSPLDISGRSVFFERCLLKANGIDDAGFSEILWGFDPRFDVSLEEYRFDYRLTSGSPAIGAGDASLSLPESSVDYYGLQRGAAPDLGAYVYRDTPQSN